LRLFLIDRRINGMCAEQLNDTGLAGLAIIAAFHQIPVDRESLWHEFKPPAVDPRKPAVFGDQEILLAARSLEMRAKLARLGQGDIDEAIMPALCKSDEGGYFILAGKIGTAAEGASATSGRRNGEPLY
jgi:subfamily B ATP-binding cassette protein HlyB/CyaB